MKYLLIKSVFAASFAIFALAYVLFYIYLAPIGNFIVVGFDGFRGIHLIGSAADIRNVLIVAGAIVLINMALAAVLARRDRFLAHLMPFASLFISILILIAVGATVANN